MWTRLAALPLHPRTPRQTQACLRASAHSWDVLKSEIVVLSHPAWKGVEHGTVSVENWADHTVQVRIHLFASADSRSSVADEEMPSLPHAAPQNLLGRRNALDPA